MQEDHTITIGLPLKIVVWKSDTQTALGYIKPSSLRQEYAITEYKAILEKMDPFMSTPHRATIYSSS